MESERFTYNVYLTPGVKKTTPLNMVMFSCPNCKKLLGFVPLVAVDSAYFAHHLIE